MSYFSKINFHYSSSAFIRFAYALFMIFILLVAGTVTAGYLYLRNYEKEYRIGVEQQLSFVARLKVSSLEQYRIERLGDAALLYKNDQFSDMVRHFLTNPEYAPGRIQLQSWLNKLQVHYHYDQIQLLDAGGVTRLPAPAGSPPVSAVIARRVSDVLRTREIAFQDFYADEYDHRPYLSLIVPILDTIGDKRAIGAVSLRIDPETYLYPFISLWPSSSRTAETLIIRREGSDVLFLNELRFRKDKALTLRIPLERKEVIAVQAALGRNGIVEGVDYAGVQVLADVRAVHDSPWVLVARMSVEEINAPVRRQLWLIIALIGALFIGAGSGVALLWRQQHVRFYRERYVAAEELLFKNIILSTQQECAIDGILVVDEDAAVISYNRRFVEMWGIPPELVEARDDASLLLFVANQPVEPEGFMTRVRYLYDHREEKSRDEIALQDGRVFDRYSAPMIGTDAKFYGRIWYFRDITERKLAEEELQRYSSELVKSNKDLQEALSNVKTLSGMLPICASCKKIRDDKGYWSEVESYITVHSGVLFSHGICPECAKKMYEELEKLKEEMT
jgi:PAS domain S-box-containing protein